MLLGEFLRDACNMRFGGPTGFVHGVYASEFALGGFAKAGYKVFK